MEPLKKIKKLHWFNIFLYAYNGAFDVLGNQVGNHQCDIERVSIEVFTETGKIKRMYYGAHEHDDGMWIEGNDIPMTKNKERIKIYIANHSHATYDKAQTWWRIYGFANDHTSNNGLIYEPDDIIFIDQNTNWNKFKGYMGSPNDCPTPLHHLWFQHENGTSTNWAKRLFCLH